MKEINNNDKIMEKIIDNDPVEIRVAMPSSDEDAIRKLYETTNKRRIESLKKLIDLHYI